MHTINEYNTFWLNSQEATNKQSQVSLDTFAANPLYKSRSLFAKVEKLHITTTTTCVKLFGQKKERKKERKTGPQLI